MELIQIALVDDHRLFRSGIKSLINNTEGYKVTLEAGDGAELIDKISSKFIPDIILLDMNMPVMDGTATAKWLRKNYPQIKVIVLSMYSDVERVLAMLKIGVKGYILKDSEPNEFIEALQKVSSGEVYFPVFVSRLLSKSVHQNEGNKLNAREVGFIRLAGTELTYKEIANHLCVSVRTVDGYRDTLFEKLNVKNRVGLVLYAIKNKIISL